jgi:preprotein translocase subunit SecD
MKLFKLIPIILCFSLLSACLPASLMRAKSGIILSIELKTDAPNIEETTERAVKILETRLSYFGADAEVGKTAPTRLEIKIYGEPDVTRIKSLLLSEGKLELMKVISASNPSPLTTYPTKEAALQSIGGSPTSSRKILPFVERDNYPPDNKQTALWIVVETPAIVNGEDLREATAISRTGSNSDYQISFSLKPEGAQKFGDWTSKNIGSYLAIVLNDEVKSAPYIRERISDQGQIDGRFTKTSAEDLALILKSGALNAKLQLVEEKTFGK